MLSSMFIQITVIFKNTCKYFVIIQLVIKNYVALMLLIFGFYLSVLKVIKVNYTYRVVLEFLPRDFFEPLHESLMLVWLLASSIQKIISAVDMRFF